MCIRDRLIVDLPVWARDTPRKVRGILTEALGARDLGDAERAAVIADLAERVEMLADDAHPHDENRKLVAHLDAEPDALFSFLTHPAPTPPTGGQSKPFGLRSSTARSGVATGPGVEPPPRAA